MSRPPVTYPMNLSDLMLFADAAAEMDGYKNTLDEPTRERWQVMVSRMYEAVERAAGLDASLIYAPGDVEPVNA